MARGKGQQTSGGTKKEKKETRQERRARLEAEAAAREVRELFPCLCHDVYVCQVPTGTSAYMLYQQSMLI